jgi:hypothetical protein
MAETKFPLDYSQHFIFEELLYRHHRQQKDLSLGIDSGNLKSKGLDLVQAEKHAHAMVNLLNIAEVKRRAFCSDESVRAHFGVAAQIKNTGRTLGKILFEFLK